jgi:hypothetical protein
MSGPPSGTPYIRAAGGVDGQGQRVAAFVALIGAVVLAAAAISLAVGAAHRNAQINALRHGGLPVQVTVTGCLAISSGVGMGVEYWQCRGDYTVAGQMYNEVIGGSRQLLDKGQTIEGVATATHPSRVSTAASVSKERATWTSYAAAIALGVVAVVLVVGWLVVSGRARARVRMADRGLPATEV